MYTFKSAMLAAATVATFLQVGSASAILPRQFSSKGNPCGPNEVGVGTRQTCIPMPQGPSQLTDGGCGGEYAAIWDQQCGGDTKASIAMSGNICDDGWNNNYKVYCENDKPIWVGDGLRTWAQCRESDGFCQNVFLSGKSMDNVQYCCALQ